VKELIHIFKFSKSFIFFIVVFKFVLFAFYTLIISHYICCFFMHSIAKLFTQSSVFWCFWVLTYSFVYFHIKTIQKHQYHNIYTLKQSSQLCFCMHINNQQRYQKIKNSKFFTLHSSVFHTSKLFSYLIFSENYKQKCHITSEVLIFLTSYLTKSYSNNIKNITSH